MSRKMITPIITEDLQDHPAVRYWRMLEPGNPMPRAIEVLKEKSKKPGKQEAKSAVYRLCNVDENGSTVIAKRCRGKTAVIERSIYQEILPSLPLHTLHFYGFIDEPDGEYCWLFLEDAGGQDYCPQNSEHRIVAGRFLGMLHSTAVNTLVQRLLPIHDTQYYFDRLLMGEMFIHANLDNPALTNSDIHTLNSLLAQYEILKFQWGEIEAVCIGLSPTLVHGDLVAKNMCVRVNDAGLSILLYDWEYASWGLPFVDLAQSPRMANKFAADPDIATYYDVIHADWPHIEYEFLHQLAKIGTIFRLISAVNWAAQDLVYEWVQRAMSKMETYVAWLENQIQTVSILNRSHVGLGTKV